MAPPKGGWYSQTGTAKTSLQVDGCTDVFQWTGRILIQYNSQLSGIHQLPTTNLPMKLDRVGLITYTPPTTFTTLWKQNKQKITCDMWHVTCDLRHVTYDTWHRCQLSSSYDLGEKVFWEKKSRIRETKISRPMHRHQEAFKPFFIYLSLLLGFWAKKKNKNKNKKSPPQWAMTPCE